MTRLLLPEMFGVMAIATTVMIGLAMFSDVGLKQSIVQHERGDDPSFLNTAWTIQIIRGVLIWGVSVFLCFVVVLTNRFGIFSTSSVYAHPILPYVIGALSFSAVISGFESTKLLEASRSILLSRITWIELLSQLAGLITMLSWVAFDRSIWALVAGSLGATFSRTVLSHVLLAGAANGWHLEPTAVRDVLQFGKWILLSSILGFFVNSGDRLLLGGLVDATVLGYYSIASLFIGAIEGVLTKIIGDVSFPAFSEVVRGQVVDLRNSYYRFFAVVAGVSYFVGSFLVTFGQAMINLLYSSRYHDAGWMLEISAVILLTVPFRLATQSYLALGMPRLQSNIIALRLGVLLVATLIGFHFFGISGALWGVVLSHLSCLPLIVYYNIKHGLFDLRIEFRLLVIVPVGLSLGKVSALLVSSWT